MSGNSSLSFCDLVNELVGININSNRRRKTTLAIVIIDEDYPCEQPIVLKDVYKTSVIADRE